MGRVTRWLRGLISGGAGGERKKKKNKDRDKWGSSIPFPFPFVAVVGDRDGRDVDEKNRHAVAIAEATAAAAEAAVTAAQAAAAVVRLTNGRVNVASGRRKQDWAALKIQAVFRGYLARRALKALKGLVKLQALVRGHIVRKQAVETLRCMQALVRAQSRARSGHAHTQQSPPVKGPSRRPHTGNGNHNRNGSMDAVDSNCLLLQSSGWNWLDCCLEERYWETLSRTGMVTDDEKTVDSAGKLHFNSKSRSRQHSHSSFTSEQYTSKNSTLAQHSIPSPPSVNMQKQSSSPPQYCNPSRSRSRSQADDLCQSPHFYSASSWTGSSRRGPFTPKSDCHGSYFNGYSDHPNYMSNTESFKAKLRSSSAPKQRPGADLDKTVSLSQKRSSVSSSSQTSSSLHTKFTRKAYPGSGRLHKMYMPLRTTQ